MKMNRGNLFLCSCSAVALLLACSVARADVDNPTLPSGAGPLVYLYSAQAGQDVPESGWLLGGPYNQTGDALDGHWDHTQGSSAWDGSAPGGTWGATVNGLNDPGGAVHEVEGTDDVLSIVDPGDPRTAGFGFNDPSNRKTYFVYGAVPGLNTAAGSPGIYMVARFRMDPQPLETNLDGSISQFYGMGAGDAGMINLGLNNFGLTMGYGGPSNTNFFIEGQTVALPSGTSFDFHEVAATMTATAIPAVYDVNVWIDGVSVFSQTNFVVQDDSEIGAGGIGFGLPATDSKGAMQLDYIGVGNLVPEPTSAVLLAMAMGCSMIFGRRR